MMRYHVTLLPPVTFFPLGRKPQYPVWTADGRGLERSAWSFAGHRVGSVTTPEAQQLRARKLENMIVGECSKRLQPYQPPQS